MQHSAHMFSRLLENPAQGKISWEATHQLLSSQCWPKKMMKGVGVPVTWYE